MRAAASSIASGSPSRRTQISATAGAFSLVTSKPGFTARARSMNSATASYCDSCASDGRLAGSGRSSGGTGYSCSPETCSALRLLARTVRFGEAVSIWLTDEPAPITCSKLSSTISMRFAPMWSMRRSIAGRPPRSDSTRVCAIVEGTSSGSLMGASSTNQTPSG